MHRLIPVCTNEKASGYWAIIVYVRGEFFMMCLRTLRWVKETLYASIQYVNRLRLRDRLI